MSLPQKPRSNSEETTFREGLAVMGSLYASAAGTTVLQHKWVGAEYAERSGCHPYDKSGWCAHA
eukprot:7390975-Prymnesium_polylepis.4